MKTKRTILIPLESAGISREELSLTARLAKTFGTTLSGLFVFNARSLDAASLPFAFEISRHSATERHLARANLDRLHRKAASDVQRLLTEISLAHQIKTSFSTLTGDLLECVLTRSDADVLLLPQRGISQALRRSRSARLEELVLFADASAPTAAVPELAQHLSQHLNIHKIRLLYDAVQAPLDLAGQLRSSGFSVLMLAVNCADTRWLASLRLGESSLLLLPWAHLGKLTPQQQLQLLSNNRSHILLLG